MRNLKKFLALVLAMMMAFSMMVTVNAASADFTDSEDVNAKFKEAVDVLSGMGVFQGTDEDGKLEFKPQSDVTRAQMAAVVYRLATGDAKDEHTHLYKDFANFSDVSGDAWYAGYVGYCADAEIVIGMGDGTFHPADKVTGYQALAMLLRAVGWGKNKEFEGANWKINVGSTATAEGLLKNVNTTSYATTLDKVATREMLAEISFQAAQIPTVQYQYGHYNKYDTTVTVAGSQNNYNPSLGLKYYGLTYHYGIVLGNAATGEDKCTKIGFTTVGDNTTTARVITDDVQSNAYVYVSGAGHTNYTNAASHVTLAFTGDQAQTGLREFGHKVKVWYDCRGDGSAYEQGFNDNLPTYAIYDKVAKTALVKTASTDTGTINAVGSDLGKVASDEGFKVASTGHNAYFNYAFAPMEAGNRGNSVSAKSAISPILENDGSTKYPLYLLISNSSDKTLDMVISLDLTVTRVTQQNDVGAVKTVGVLNGNNSNKYFGDSNDYQTSGGDYVNLAQANVVDTANSAKILGAKVVAIEITGTTGGNDGASTGNATTPATMYSSYYYQLCELTRVEKYTVVARDTSDQTVTLSDGSTLERSPLALAVSSDFMPNAQVKAPANYGEYNFTLDADGKYIFWEPITVGSRFVYGTYLDYQSGLGTSTYTYPLIGVSIDGQPTNDNVVSYTDKTNPDPTGTHGGAIPNALPLSDGTGANYLGSPLIHRDSNGIIGTWKPGMYVGYIIDDEGNLSYVKDTTDAWNNTGVQQAKAGDFGGAGANRTTIGATDVTLGVKEVGPAGTKLYLTENTQFYIVSGAGTDTQKITPIKGLSALMEGMDQVIIDGNTDLTAGIANAGGVENPYIKTASNTAYEMIYYTSSPFTYAQDYASSAFQVDTVFIPEVCLVKTPTVNNSLVFVGNSTGGLLNAVGTANAATQFTMYKDGVEGKYWVLGLQDAGSNANDADSIIDSGHNVFYNLVDSGKKAADGQPIYKIAAVSSATAGKLIGKYWDGSDEKFSDIISNDSGSTAVASTQIYKATTRDSQVATIGINNSGTVLDAPFNVASADVKNLDTKNFPGIADTLDTLNAASSLANNTGITVSCILSSDSSNRIVSLIYVNYVP